MRSLGSIAALLLFIEWHPRAINSPEDFVSDCSDLEVFGPQLKPVGGQVQHTTDTGGSDRIFDPSSIPEKLNLVAPAYRSNKMSWYVSSHFHLSRHHS